MRLRRAHALALTFHDDEAVVHNFLRQTRVAVSGGVLDLVRCLDSFQPVEQLAARSDDRAGLRDVLGTLLEAGILVVEGSDEEQQDAAYRAHWRWGAVAGFYHFAIRNAEYLPGQEQEAIVQEYAATAASPPLLRDNNGLPVTALPPFSHADAFFGVLEARESTRRFAKTGLPLQTLADCLFAGNGVKRFQETGAFGTLPKTMTPSGGARNPFELFVHARRVEDLAEGVYHYSSLDHDLGRLEGDGHLPSSCLGGQEWADSAAAMVYLVADFSRTAWKYRQAVSYRVVLMEAGFIAQNILLAATRHGAAGTPSAALAESRIEAMCHCHSPSQAAILAVALGCPST